MRDLHIVADQRAGQGLKPFKSRIFLIGASWDGDAAPFAVEAAVFFDELGGIRPIYEVGRDAPATHADMDVVAHLEVEVGGIHTAVCADRTHLLSAFHALAGFYHHFVKVSI